MVHNPNARGSQPRYTVTSQDEVTKPSGVTTILGATLSKDLIGWAIGCMADHLNDRLEDGITADDIEEAALAYEKKRNAGGTTGTEAHALVEKYLKGEPVSLVTTTAEAKKAYQAFVRWYEQVKPQMLNVEAVVYSEAFEYAGTYDCMLKLDGKVYLCDLKTTNSSRKAPKGVYAENFLQLGAYAAAHREQRDYELAHGGTQLPQIDDLMVISAKKNGQLDIVTASELGIELSLCEDLFYAVVGIWRFLKVTTKSLGGY